MSRLDHVNRILGVRLSADAAGDRRTAGVANMHRAYVIDLDRIAPDPAQVRRQFDAVELEELTASLRDVGQLQPVVVRWDAAADRYVLVAGERRYRAAQLAGLRQLNAVVVDVPADRDRLTHLQLVENALRSDVSPVDAAAAYRSLMEAWGCTQSQLADRLRISQSRVSRTLAILDLPAEVQQQVVAGDVPAMATVKRAARRTGRRRPKGQRPQRLTCPAGVATITPRAGFTVAQVLQQLLEVERSRDAA